MQQVFSPNAVNEREQSAYRNDGYILVGRLLNDAELASIRGEEGRLRQIVPGPGRQKNRNLSIAQVCPNSAIVREFALHGRQLDLVRRLIGPNLLLWFTQFVTKMPDESTGRSEFPWHQDNGYVAIEPPNNLTVWIALDDVNESNGCLWVAPRSHLKGLLPHHQLNGSGFLDAGFDEGEIPIIMRAGEAVIFSGLTFHRSKLNTTSEPRRALVLEYCDMASTCHFDKSDIYVAGASNNRLPVTKHPGTIPVCGEIPIGVTKGE